MDGKSCKFSLNDTVGLIILMSFDARFGFVLSDLYSASPTLGTSKLVKTLRVSAI